MLRYNELESGGNKAWQLKPENDSSWLQEDHSGRKTTSHVERIGSQAEFFTQSSVLIFFNT